MRRTSAQLFRRFAASSGAVAIAAVPSCTGVRPSVAPASSNVASQIRFQGQQQMSGSAPKAPPPPPDGIVEVNVRNLQAEIQTAIPTMLFFHAANHPEVAKYTASVKQLVTMANKEHRDYHTEQSGQAGVLVKLGTVDVEKERLLAEQFQITESTFPIIFFLLNGKVLDRMIGIVSAEQVKDALNAFIKYAEENRSGDLPKEARGVGHTTLDRMDPDDENVMTLLHVGQKAIRDKDMKKAKKLLEKAKGMAEPKMVQLKKDVGLGVKKVTPQMLDKLRKDPHYAAFPMILASLATVAMVDDDRDVALQYCQQVRKDYPWAIKASPDVAQNVSRIELVILVDLKDTVEGLPPLMKDVSLMDGPVELYQTKLKYATQLFMEERTTSAVEELLKLIRAELKMLPALKAAKIVDENASLNQAQSTPARKALFLMFDHLGNDHELVIRARKKMQTFLFA